MTFFVTGISIQDSEITTRLNGLYGGVTPNLLTGIAARESSYRQFVQRTLFTFAGLWPNESYDGGSHVGLMQMPINQPHAWNWLANTQNAATLFNAKLATARRLATRIINAHAGLPQPTALQIENMALVLYGPHASASLSEQ
ncbi:MAG: hypothetical protein ACRD1W_19885, partial [Vicinamibacterales bacterium]